MFDIRSIFEWSEALREAEAGDNSKIAELISNRVPFPDPKSTEILEAFGYIVPIVCTYPKRAEEFIKNPASKKAGNRSNVSEATIWLIKEWYRLLSLPIEEKKEIWTALAEQGFNLSTGEYDTSENCMEALKSRLALKHTPLLKKTKCYEIAKLMNFVSPAQEEWTQGKVEGLLRRN